MLPADGMLDSERMALYTVPQGKTARLTSIEVVNMSGSVQRFTLYVSVSGSAVPITPPGTYLEADCKGEDTIKRTLKSGMAILGVASASSAIAYTIHGEET